MQSKNNGSGAGGSSASNTTTAFASSFDEFVSSGSVTSSHSPMRGSSDATNTVEKKSDDSSQILLHPVSKATASFFKLLQTILCYRQGYTQSPINCPITHFAFRVLEQVALRGGPGPGFYAASSKNSNSITTSTGSAGGSSSLDRTSASSNIARESLSGSRSRLLFQHFDVDLLLLLVKVVPELSTSLAIITRLFDTSRYNLF